MVATADLRKSPYMKEWMAEDDPPKEANTVKKMNGRSQGVKSPDIRMEGMGGVDNF